MKTYSNELVGPEVVQNLEQKLDTQSQQLYITNIVLSDLEKQINSIKRKVNIHVRILYCLVGVSIFTNLLTILFS